MIKVYKINGKTEVHEVFTTPSGKATFKVAFVKGNLDPKNRVPARFSTDNPVIQAVIEGSEKFGRTIFLDKVYGEDIAKPVEEIAPIPVKKAKTAPKTAAVKDMPEVKTIADAATVLLAEGAPASDIDGTVEGARKAAKSLGLSFPNLKEEE